jgi:hypothetical protein
LVFGAFWPRKNRCGQEVVRLRTVANWTGTGCTARLQLGRRRLQGLGCPLGTPAARRCHMRQHEYVGWGPRQTRVGATSGTRESGREPAGPLRRAVTGAGPRSSHLNPRVAWPGLLGPWGGQPWGGPGSRDSPPRSRCSWLSLLLASSLCSPPNMPTQRSPALVPSALCLAVLDLAACCLSMPPRLPSEPLMELDSHG